MKRLAHKGLALLAACTLLLCGCQKEEHDETAEPAPAALSAFLAEFPNAREVQWGKIHDYDVAAFSLAAAQRHSAWYAPGSGACALTQIALTSARLSAEAPAVAQAWQTSPLRTAGYRIDGIDRLSYLGRGPVYRLAVGLDDHARTLAYAADGTLLSDRLQAGDGALRQLPCPQPLIDFTDTHYPDALLAGFATENRQGVLYYEVGVFHDGERKVLLFDANYTFLVCVAAIDDPALLPQPVRETLLASAPDPRSWYELSRYEDHKCVAAAYALKFGDTATGREGLVKADAEGNPIR